MKKANKYFLKTGVVLNSCGTVIAVLTYISEELLIYVKQIFTQGANLFIPTVRNIILFSLNLSLILFLDIILPCTAFKPNNLNKRKTATFYLYAAILVFQTVALSLRQFLPAIELYIILSKLNLFDFYTDFIAIYPIKGTVFVIFGNVLIMLCLVPCRVKKEWFNQDLQKQNGSKPLKKSDFLRF